jgi:hypothetical protein
MAAWIDETKGFAAKAFKPAMQANHALRAPAGKPLRLFPAHGKAMAAIRKCRNSLVCQSAQ